MLSTFCLVLACRIAELEKVSLKRIATVLPALEPLRQGPAGREVADEAASGTCKTPVTQDCVVMCVPRDLA